MQSALDSLATGYPWLIFYLLPVTALYLLGLITYVKLTPHKELELVQQGNMAAAVTFSALVISLTLPLAACLVRKVSLWDTTIWAAISLALQLLLFRVTDAIFKGMPERIERDEVPAAIVLVGVALIAGAGLALFARERSLERVVASGRPIRRV